MRAVFPIVLAVVSTAIGASAGNVVGGIIFGLIMGGAGWALMAKPSNPESQLGGTGPTAQATQSGPSTPSIESADKRASLPSYAEVGRILAMSVAEALKHDRGQQEAALVRQCGISDSTYTKELYFLHSSSAYVAVSELISEPAAADQVRAGFVAHWNDAANSSPEQHELRKSFQERFPAYLAAHEADNTPLDPDQLRVGHVAAAFANFLSGVSAPQVQPGGLAVLTMSHIPEAHWSVMHEAAQRLFESTNLPLRSPRAAQ